MRAKARPRVLLACAAAGALAAGLAQVRRAEPQPVSPVRAVADVRFGIIQPPVVAQRDITVRAPTSNQQLTEMPLECSGIAWLDGRLLISSDRHGHVVFECPIDLEAMTIGLPSPHVVIRNEQQLLDDAESLTVRAGGPGRSAAYVFCSLSNDRGELPLPKRQHMLRFTVDRSSPLETAAPVVLSAGVLRDSLHRHFEAVGVPPYRTYYAEFAGSDKNTLRWGNVEGTAFAPDGATLLCGMRNPLLEGKAICVAVTGVDAAFDAMDPSRMKVVDVFLLDLDERGVSDLCWDPMTGGYLIAAGKSNGPWVDRDQPFPPNTLDSALFWWSGQKGQKPALFARAPDMKIEAICRLGNSRFIAICSDEGDVSESREQRQSVLTVLYFTGLEPGHPADGDD